jgi:hypothetical protein
MRCVTRTTAVIIAALLFGIFMTAIARAAHEHHGRHFAVPSWFRKDANCIHSIEAPNWRWSPSFHPGYSYWNGYYTGMQFAPSTWERANQLLGLRTNPANASKLSVMLHAEAIVKYDALSGNAWREWYPDNIKCGLPYGFHA